MEGDLRMKVEELFKDTAQETGEIPKNTDNQRELFIGVEELFKELSKDTVEEIDEIPKNADIIRVSYLKLLRSSIQLEEKIGPIFCVFSFKPLHWVFAININWKIYFPK